ncbi:hypothetical protein TthAA229_18570 [Thermus thermophilus]|nr:hypothetical protein TthAA229_18570 [Thermus thermophilus]
MSVLEHILFQTRARPSGKNRWIGHCPAHEDREPSLSIRSCQELCVRVCVRGAYRS